MHMDFYWKMKWKKTDDVKYERIERWKPAYNNSSVRQNEPEIKNKEQRRQRMIIIVCVCE